MASVFELRCLRSIVPVWWENCIGDLDVRLVVLAVLDRGSTSELVVLRAPWIIFHLRSAFGIPLKRSSAAAFRRVS